MAENIGKLHGAMMTVTTLTDGGQDPVTVAQALHDFLAAAQSSLDLALYDFHLEPGLEELVVDTLIAAGKRGVAVRIVYNADFRAPIPVPPPPTMTPEDVARLGLPSKPIAGIPDLMHHKYVVRDRSSVWTGSTNWTDDSWSREENVIAVVDSPELATAYTLDFEQLWDVGIVEEAGRVEPRPVHVDGIEIRPWFCPGYGDALSHRIAKAIGRAKRRVRICSPVITAAPVLATLAQVIADGKVDVAGAVDMPQVEDVQRQWGPTGVRSWKLPLLLDVIGSGRFAGKRSTPWGPGTVHDYMHAKITVADDVVFLGSFNLSHSGEMNSENVLEIHDPALAERLAGYVDGVRARYPVASLSPVTSAVVDVAEADVAYRSPRGRPSALGLRARNSDLFEARVRRLGGQVALADRSGHVLLGLLAADRFVTFQRRCSGGGPFVSARIIAPKVAPDEPHRPDDDRRDDQDPQDPRVVAEDVDEQRRDDRGDDRHAPRRRAARGSPSSTACGLRSRRATHGRRVCSPFGARQPSRRPYTTLCGRVRPTG